jgi:hypothetical protein
MTVTSSAAISAGRVARLTGELAADWPGGRGTGGAEGAVAVEGTMAAVGSAAVVLMTLVAGWARLGAVLAVRTGAVDAGEVACAARLLSP